MATDHATVVPTPTPSPAGMQPQRFWQWLLMFPAALLPLYTALPIWADKGLALYHNYANGSAKESEAQIQLAQKNMKCLQAPYQYYVNPSKISIDGTICGSGDILIRAMDSDERQAMYFVPLDMIKGRLDTSTAPGGPAPVKLSMKLDDGGMRRIGAFLGAGLGIGEAKAALPLASPAVANGAMRLQAMPVQFVVQVLWTAPTPNPRFVIQHIRRPDGCFNQTVDLANGAVVQIAPAPC